MRIGSKVWVAGVEAVVVDVTGPKPGRRPGDDGGHRTVFARTPDGVTHLLTPSNRRWSFAAPACPDCDGHGTLVSFDDEGLPEGEFCGCSTGRAKRQRSLEGELAASLGARS